MIYIFVIWVLSAVVNLGESTAVCPTIDGEDSVYFPVTDCTKFCQCSNGDAYLHDCPQGLHFNPTLNVCDWPEDAGCATRISNSTIASSTIQNPCSDQETSTATQAAINTTTTSTTTQAVTESSNICVEENIVCPAVDGENSVYISVSDCTKFCQCSNGAAYEHDCPAGLHFNSNLNVCDWPEDAGCDSSATNTTTTQAATEASKTTTTSSATQGATDTTTTSTTTQAATEASNICVDENIVCSAVDGEDSVYFPVSDCTKFCQCSNGAAYEHDCPGGLHFNSILNVCDWPEDAGCDSGAINTTTTQAATEASKTTTTSSATQGATNTTTTSTTTQAVTEASNICVEENIVCPAVDGEDSVYLPLSDCTKFCQCSNGVAYEHDCPGGLHFNSNLNICDWPEDAGCDSGTTNTTTTKAATEATKTTTQAGTNTTTTSTTTQAVTESSNICVDEDIVCPAVDGEDSLYFPVSDCTKFCQCSNGVAYEHDCPGSLHFNSNLNVCDWPEDAGCDRGATNTTTTQAVTEATETTTQAGINTTTTSTTTQAVTEASNICVDEDIVCPAIDGEDSVYFPVSDCTKFCQCSNGDAYEHDCPGGLHFNSNLNVCDWPEDAGCDSDATNTITTQAATEASKTTTTSSATQAATNTTTTSTTTQAVTEASNICVDENIVCPAVDGEDSVYFPVSDCTKFCQCSNGVAYEHDCLGGLHFNSNLNVCDWPEDAGCDSGATNTTTTQAATKSSKTTTTSSATQAATNTTTAATTTHAVTEASNICVEENIVCPAVDGEDSVYFPVSDCTKFCQCSNGVAYEHDCPGGLHFNYNLNVCDWPEDAGCDSLATNTTTTQAATEATKKATTSSATQAATNTTTTSTTTHAVTEASNICVEENIVCPAVDGEESVYFPVSNCTKFCQCSNGAAYEHDCPTGLHFNSKLNVCDWPEDAECDGGSNS